jgi:hypothetical protein
MYQKPKNTLAHTDHTDIHAYETYTQHAKSKAARQTKTHCPKNQSTRRLKLRQLRQFDQFKSAGDHCAPWNVLCSASKHVYEAFVAEAERRRRDHTLIEVDIAVIAAGFVQETPLAFDARLLRGCAYRVTVLVLVFNSGRVRVRCVCA